MKLELKVGVFSPNDPRPWVREENLSGMLEREKLLVETLRGWGAEVLRGGEGAEGQDQLAWSTALVREHVERLARFGAEVMLINQGSWTFPYDSVDAVVALRHHTGEAPRVVIFSHKETTVPGLVAGMAAAGGLERIGVPYSLCYGDLAGDSGCRDWLLHLLRFHMLRTRGADRVHRAVAGLSRHKYLALGGMSLRMPTTTADVDQWQKLFGITYEALDQSELVDRALTLIRWDGKPGRSAYTLADPRLERACAHLVEEGHGSFDFSRASLPSLELFVYQLSLYYAAVDLFGEVGATFGGIKCQDELSARHCTACLATSFLGNDVGPDGKPKPVIPIACENDMDSALTQLWLHLLSGSPAGFGDFRDVEDGVLAIVNCGQHPPYFFGTPGENGACKLDRCEYLGQEIFYAAGGSSVRGRTPGGQQLTVARLARENLRYYLVATVLETLDVDPAEHARYDLSWPIIKGRLPIPDETLISMWPCNHLGFTFGDWTPHLVEMAQRVGIGFRVYDATGREHRGVS
jgi:L-fucose isomerase-like protein